MIGAIINTYKGIKDNLEYKKRLETVEWELDSVKSIEQLISKIDEPYDRVRAQNQILLAEYHEHRQKNQSLTSMKKIWEMVKRQMATNIQQTEQQLQDAHATKLDIVRIVSSLSQLANEFDLELQTIKQQIASNNKPINPSQQLVGSEFKSSLSKQKESIDRLEKLVNKFAEKYEHLQNDFDLLTSKTNVQQQILEKLSKENKSQFKEMSDLRESISIQNKEYNEFEKITSNKLEQLFEKVTVIFERIQGLQSDLHASDQRIDENFLELQQQLNDQKIQWTKHANRIDKSIVALAKAQKKSILQWTIPLYVVVIGIILSLFIV